ncbi:MAG: septal ring lytic transglycosylase RlpA family protein [Candidatus Omnitrophica bacterium]|jgi:rare lipoprotein A|nr:septal ring lytic transglycosylase RlpA family protein [Candidatus Omnitrophota bacterium]
MRIAKVLKIGILILLVVALAGYAWPGLVISEGVASYYSYECARLPMANGKPFDPENRTCASWFYDFGTVLIVKSLDTGLSTEVVVTDRGPNKRLVREGRIIDLSKRAFQDICRLEKGLTRVAIIVKE